jgi:hypothetical protein
MRKTSKKPLRCKIVLRLSDLDHAKASVDRRMTAATVTDGRVFRANSRHGTTWGKGISENACIRDSVRWSELRRGRAGTVSAPTRLRLRDTASHMSSGDHEAQGDQAPLAEHSYEPHTKPRRIWRSPSTTGSDLRSSKLSIRAKACWRQLSQRSIVLKSRLYGQVESY